MQLLSMRLTSRSVQNDQWSVLREIGNESLSRGELQSIVGVNLIILDFESSVVSAGIYETRFKLNKFKI